ncbi:beta-eliminating lyase-related protein [Cereibacter azotoformans]|uniref:L-threonine aldolase n=1 Tax=Cereibacter azotoformans TaxID=43057 RepID=A0A2T5KCB1_9RHOB|nr:beta-eliminating lyase-related protein [Cereibacter azotoformans]AXQ94078.1 low specificity L-threonine aldolase [Cereibacter sphaeroides]MBO4168118.1 low specificity L-threonine aldolase [Cereibacter azotoformans]PTR20054.1 L-threonine aldolase [Cereibacter azotoformans]UIJ29613.1 beta-eliminating lyase-related protein [Cereibacter azotoformans]
MFFASDNGSAVAPEVLAALAADPGPAMPYGADPVTAEVTAMIRTLFEAPEAEVALVTSGTAANALALATLSPPWGAIFCREEAHIEADECNAAEFFSGGGKLVTLPGEQGKLAPETLAAALARFAPGDLHAARPAALSLTNVTELGTLYRPAEIAALTAVARTRGLGCHLDGARFANALVAADASPAEMSWRAGIDILSLGGTKNGLMGVEAVVVFDPARADELRIRRKRAGHLMSKHRYLALQMRACLADGLWLRLARHANAAAARLAEGLAALPDVRLVAPAEANLIFAELPQPLAHRARAAGAVFYDMGGKGNRVRVRLVCSWNTSDAEVDAFVAALA